MAVDRKQRKNKKKREQRLKAYRKKAEQCRRHRRSQESAVIAEEAFRFGDYRTALTHARKRLKAHPHDCGTLNLALNCAELLGDEGALYSLLCGAWNQGSLYLRKGYLQLGELAFNRRESKLALQVFQGLKSGNVHLDRPLNKGQRELVTRYLTSLEGTMQEERAIEAIQKTVVPSFPSPPSETGKKATGPLHPLTGGQKDKPQERPQEILLKPEIVFNMNGEPLLTAIKEFCQSDMPHLELALQAYQLSFRTSYDQMLCLPTLRNVESLWYQEETARKVMKTFRGRAILADEVGLGKTIEAGLVLKEYIIRGLVRTALILTPSSLVNQWREELQEKFELSFVTTNDLLFRQSPGRFWKSHFIIASIHTAKTVRQFEKVISRGYDMIIVDEAHHLKNRNTLNWKLVNETRKTFLILLTATPVQNNLEELYNLVTLLRPGHLKTHSAFRKEFVSRGNPTDPRNRVKLKRLLKEVMIRNTRSVTRLHLPPRFAYTTQVSPSVAEEAFYQAISEFVAGQSGNGSKDFSRMALRRLLEAGGSSHLAAMGFLKKIAQRNLDGISKRAMEMVALGESIGMGTKVRKVLELLQASPGQKIIFVNYLATLEYLRMALEKQNIPHVVFQGGLSKIQKQAAIDEFRGGRQVLLSTGIGGEGQNLQFCHTMINYDLPWNPMEIEQRIGRIHRIGQKKEVQIYNFCASGSIEDHILEVLDRKINMFELVIGEIDMILGRLKGEQEFSDLVYEIWVQNHDESERRKAFGALANRLKRARSAYETSKELDSKLFQEDFDM